MYCVRVLAANKVSIYSIAKCLILLFTSMSDEFESSSNSDIKEFINQDGDFYMNFDAQQIKKQLISMNQKKQIREENIDE